MNRLLADNLTSGNGDWVDIAQGGDYVIQPTGASTLTGTLQIQTGFSDGTVASVDTDNLEFTAVPAPLVVTLGAGMKVRAAITAGTAALTIRIHKAHAA